MWQPAEKIIVSLWVISCSQTKYSVVFLREDNNSISLWAGENNDQDGTQRTYWAFTQLRSLSIKSVMYVHHGNNNNIYLLHIEISDWWPENTNENRTETCHSEIISQKTQMSGYWLAYIGLVTRSKRCTDRRNFSIGRRNYGANHLETMTFVQTQNHLGGRDIYTFTIL